MDRSRRGAALLVVPLCASFLVGAGSVPFAAQSALPGLSAALVPAVSVTPGAKLWAARYNGPVNGNDEASALGVSPDGTRVFVTGQSIGSTSCCADYATVAYNASTGARLWVARYHGPGNGALAKALGVSPDGTKVFVTEIGRAHV